MEPAAPSEPWQISCSREQLLAIQHTKEFALLMALSRCANQLRFGSELVKQHVEGERSTHSGRQLMSALFMTAATFYEGVRLVSKEAGPYFHTRPEFEALVATWRGDNRKFIDAHVAPIRDFFVNHFLTDKIEHELARITFADGCVFAVGDGDEAHHLHFNFVDFIAVRCFVGEVPAGVTFDAARREVLAQFSTLVGDFITKLETLMNVIVRDYGFVIEERRPDMPGEELPSA